MSTDETRIRRAPKKFTGSAKIMITTFSLIGFVGSWNLIARVENQQAKASEAPPPSPVLPPTTSTSAAVMPTSTPWPAIAPLPELPPVPTLRSVANSVPEAAINPAITLDIAPIQVAPLPTMAPLPAIPDMPPPPPPPPPMPAGNWQNSGGS